MAAKCRQIDNVYIKELLKSTYHEERLLALLIMVDKFKREPEQQQKIFDLYVKNKKYVNNWDLVDSSAPHIVGGYLMHNKRDLLYQYAHSKNLWDRRIAILATLRFIKNDDFADTLQISEILLQDKQDLIHKAVGWMLREIGKRDLKSEEAFLRKHYQQMPRTMLRYAIEKFEKKRRKQYLHGKL